MKRHKQFKVYLSTYIDDQLETSGYYEMPNIIDVKIDLTLDLYYNTWEYLYYALELYEET